MSGGNRTRVSDAAGRCLSCSATDTQSKDGRSRTLSARVGAALLSQEHVLVSKGCPGRIRTCTRLVNSEPHNRCATGQTVSVRMAGFEPAFSSTPSWRIARLSYILRSNSSGGWGRTSGLRVFSAALSPPELHRNRTETPAGVEPASCRFAADRLAIRPRRHRAKQKSQRWDSNPLGPRYEDGARPVGHRWRRTGWPVGVEPTQPRFTAGSRNRFGFGHSIPVRSRTSPPTFAGSCASATPQGCHSQYPGQESNLGLDLRRVV